MEIDHYKHLYAGWDAKYHPDATLAEIEDKVLEEMGELAEEIAFGGSREHRINEALDAMNTLIKYLTALGVADVLDAGWRKLEKTGLKYEKQITE